MIRILKILLINLGMYISLQRLYLLSGEYLNITAVMSKILISYKLTLLVLDSVSFIKILCVKLDVKID